MIDDALKITRDQLGELAVMQHRINESEKLILKRAEMRLDEINRRIQETQPHSLEKSQEYMDLIKERGQLHIIIAQAKASIQI